MSKRQFPAKAQSRKDEDARVPGSAPAATPHPLGTIGSMRFFAPLRLCGKLLQGVLFLLLLALIFVLLLHGPPSSAIGAKTRNTNGESFRNLTRRTATQVAHHLQQPTPAKTPVAKIEGCVSCHGNIEPMHKYGTTETFDKLKDGKDAFGLTCTACHGGNPAPQKTSDNRADAERVKRDAHVQPRFPNEWKRDGRYTGANPERTNTLLAREALEFVRFINPGDIRVAAKTW